MSKSHYHNPEPDSTIIDTFINSIPNKVHPHVFHQFEVSYPFCKQGPKCLSAHPYLMGQSVKKIKKPGWHVRLMLLEQMLPCWWCPVSSSKVMDLLHWAMPTVLYRHMAMAIRMATKERGHQNGHKGACIFLSQCFACNPGGLQGNTEQEVTNGNVQQQLVQAQESSIG